MDDDTIRSAKNRQNINNDHIPVYSDHVYDYLL